MKKQTIGSENKGNSSIYLHLDEPDDIQFFFFFFFFAENLNTFNVMLTESFAWL